MSIHHAVAQWGRLKPLPLAILGGLCLASSTAFTQVSSALGSTYSAAATGRAGTVAAESGDPMDAMQGNPAGLLGISKPVFELGGAAGFASGSFRNSVDPHGGLSGTAGIIPYAAFATPITSSHWRAGFAITPDMLERAKWSYLDPAGTAGVSYGEQTNKSEIIAIRGAAGFAGGIGSRLALGGTVGLTYNRNALDAPYIFQQQPALAGLKVLLNLHTQGFGWNGSAGAQWLLAPKARLGLAWKSATFVQSHGDANGTASALFNVLGVTADPTFHYRAEVDNHLPQTFSVAGAFDVNRRLRLDIEEDFTNWSTAFYHLPVKLKDGTNPVINSVAGNSAIEDEIWLRWRNQESIRMGVESPLNTRWTARAGYAYATNPVPSATLTPMTAAILRNTLAGGIGWKSERWKADVAYQAQLPASQSVGQSQLLAGEYDNSRVSVMTQSITVTLRSTF